MIDVMKLLDDMPIKLIAGEGTPETGGCWMSALSRYAGESWSDHPDCVCPVIAAYCIKMNDALPSDEARGRVIGPRLFDPIGTKDTPEVEDARRWVLVDRVIRHVVPLAFDVAGIHEHAEKLRVLERVTPDTAARAADTAARAAWAAWAARAAADAAARAAWAYAADAARAARAAADAAARAAWAYAAADHECFIRDECLPILDDMLAIGNRAPVEMACSMNEFRKAVQCV